MSNITTYPGISVVAGQDLMIISDTSIKGNPTKTVSVDALGSYIGATGGGAGVATVNGVSGAVTLVAGTNITLGVVGQNITINSATSTGTVTSVAATFGGNAFALAGSPITGAGTLAITPVGSAAQYVNGAGNLATLASIPTNIVLSTTGTVGAATLTGNALNIPNYSGVITQVTTTGTDGESALTGSTLNIPNYNAAYKELFFQITNVGGSYSAAIHRNTTGATFTFARTGTGSYEMQASSSVFGTTARTFFSAMNANRVAPASGTGTLPQPTVARLKSGSLFVVEVFNNNTGTIAGNPADIPGSGGYNIFVEVRIIAISV